MYLRSGFIDLRNFREDVCERVCVRDLRQIRE